MLIERGRADRREPSLATELFEEEEGETQEEVKYRESKENNRKQKVLYPRGEGSKSNSGVTDEKGRLTEEVKEKEENKDRPQEDQIWAFHLRDGTDDLLEPTEGDEADETGDGIQNDHQQRRVPTGIRKTSITYSRLALLPYNIKRNQDRNNDRCIAIGGLDHHLVYFGELLWVRVFSIRYEGEWNKEHEWVQENSVRSLIKDYLELMMYLVYSGLELIIFILIELGLLALTGSNWIAI